jgi:hypothetical protein
MATTTVAAYESESVVEAQDFYPYGATCIDGKINSESLIPLDSIGTMRVLTKLAFGTGDRHHLHR